MSKKINEVIDAVTTPVEETPAEVPTEVPETKGKDMKVLGLKVHVEKVEKKPKEKKEKKPKEEKSGKGLKIAAGIGCGLAIAGAIGKGVLDIMANRTTQLNEEPGVYMPEDSTSVEACTEAPQEATVETVNVDQA